MPSGMLISSTNANPSVQGGVAVGLETGSGTGVEVRIMGVAPCTKSWVGVAALGAMKGVGVGVGAQAGSRRNASRIVSRLEQGVKRLWDFIVSP